MNGRSRVHLWACAAAAVLLVHLLATATGGFEHWTFESLRRERAAEGRMRAPDAMLLDSLGRTSRPWSPESTAEEGPLPGDVFIVDFIFTRCTSVCQALGTALQQMQAQLEAPAPDAAGRHHAPRVRLLTISFDVVHDDTDALHAYALRHRADPSRWTVAVPSGRSETRALLQALDVVVIPDGWGGYTHNAGLHVIDSRGRLAGIYDLDAWPRALSHARTLAGQPES